MTIQCEETPPSLVVPDLDLVIITTGDKQGLSRVEIDSSNGAIVFFETINQSSHAVIPQLDGGGVKGDENPWSSMLRSVPMLQRVVMSPRDRRTASGGMRFPWLWRILTQTARWMIVSKYN
jgi:hypothetical protein